MLDRETRRSVLTAQKNEITEHFIYEKLSQTIEDPHNKEILRRISRDEREHYDFWKKHTRKDVEPDKSEIWKYYLISKILGLTFGIKLMEKGEEQAQETYEKIAQVIPGAERLVEDEDEHERMLIGLIDEERLEYVGSMVLGLNDALVELTGTLAGLTLALQDTNLIALTGSITGIAASFSMAASEYLSTKTEESAKDPIKASVYTGSAYILTVLFLILPFLLLKNLYLCLVLSITNAILVLLLFTYYVSVAKDISFRKRFTEMSSISLGVAALSFAIGYLIRIFLNIEAG